MSSCVTDAFVGKIWFFKTGAEIVLVIRGACHLLSMDFI